jgi:hypothetical protein
MAQLISNMILGMAKNSGLLETTSMLRYYDLLFPLEKGEKKLDTSNEVCFHR